MFAVDRYTEIKKISSELAYQIYLLGEIEDRCYPKTKRFKALKGHIKFALFSLMVKVLSANNFPFGRAESTKLFEGQCVTQKTKKVWTKTIILCGNYIYKLYRKNAKLYREKKGKDLTYNNYFKSFTFMKELLGSNVPPQAISMIKNKVTKRRKSNP